MWLERGLGSPSQIQKGNYEDLSEASPFSQEMIKTAEESPSTHVCIFKGLRQTFIGGRPEESM